MDPAIIAKTEKKVKNTLPIYIITRETFLNDQTFHNSLLRQSHILYYKYG